MGKIRRPSEDEARKHPLHGQLNGEVPWLDGCREYNRKTCLDCPVLLEKCPAEHPRVNKGGRLPGSKNKEVPFQRKE